MKKSDVPLPVKLVCGILYRDEDWLGRGIQDLELQFGRIDFRSNDIEFRFTDYYFEEMGNPLFRRFISFENLIDPARLAAVKVFTNSLEESYTYGLPGRRVLNIDPGYLNPTAYILATSKNYAHRIYLGEGIFAQQELLFGRKRVQTLEWTYPDYRSLEYQQILGQIRQIYLSQIRADRAGFS